MKLSLWQQFSSNHSASFTIIGIFESTEVARQAYEAISAILSAIDNWHWKYPEEAEELWDSQDASPVEQKFGQQYDIKWDVAVWWEGYRTDIYKQFVTISSAGQVDSGAYPINKLLEKLGGEVLVDGDIFRDFNSGDLSFDITCVAPTEEIAAEVAALTSGEQINSTVKFKLLGRKESYGSSIGDSLIRMLKLIEDKKCSIHYFGSTQRRGHYIKPDE